MDIWSEHLVRSVRLAAVVFIVLASEATSSRQHKQHFLNSAASWIMCVISVESHLQTKSVNSTTEYCDI